MTILHEAHEATMHTKKFKPTELRDLRSIVVIVNATFGVTGARV